MENEPTAELIRAQLRRLRVRAELSQEEFGRLVHFSGSQVSAVELGHRPLDRFFLARADEVLGTGGLLMSLLKLAERDGQPSWFRPWLEAERQAQQLRCYQPSLIPGLLQTENYARAMIRTDDMLAEQEAERRLAVRLDRQTVLAGADPPKFVAVIEETVLRRADESFRGLMSQQVTHLIEASSHPTHRGARHSGRHRTAHRTDRTVHSRPGRRRRLDRLPGEPARRNSDRQR